MHGTAATGCTFYQSYYFRQTQLIKSNFPIHSPSPSQHVRVHLRREFEEEVSHLTRIMKKEFDNSPNKERETRGIQSHIHDGEVSK